VGSVVALTGILVGLALQAGVPVPLAVAIGLLTGLVVGCFNGLAITRFKIPFFITTLATMIIIRGVAYLVTGGMPVAGFPRSFLVIGQGFLGPVPVPILVVLFVYGLGGYILKYMRFGRHLYAIGGNAEAARLSGINVEGHRLSVYMACGALASLSGMVLMARLDSGQPTAGEGYELDAIAAVVIGGTKLTGGEGGLWGTLLGALILGVLSNGLNLLDVSPYWQYILKGCVILLAVAPILSGSGRFRVAR
jgi:ribose transport system permease protein